MKGKTTWKSKGLRAKHWREAAHAKGRPGMALPRILGGGHIERPFPQARIRPRPTGV